MKHIAAYALLVLGGKSDPSAADVEKVLKEAGAKADSNQIDTLIKALHGKQFHSLVSEGTKALGSMGGAAPAQSAATGKAAPAAAPKEEEKKEEEADVDMGDLFGGGDYWARPIMV